MRSPGQPFDLRAALAEEVRAAQEEVAAAAEDIDAVHRARVRLKRARAVARVGADAAPGLQSLFDQSARSVMRCLAQARAYAALAAAARDASKRAPKKAAAGLVNAAHGLDSALRTAPAPDYQGINNALRDLLALAQVWPETSARQIVRGCRELARQAKRARRRALGDAGPSARHIWRKCESDRRHAIMVLGEAWPRRRGLRKSTRVVAALGRERDAALLIARIKKAPALAGDDDGARRACKVLKRRKRKFADRANAVGATLTL